MLAAFPLEVQSYHVITASSSFTGKNNAYHPVLSPSCTGTLSFFCLNGKAKRGSVERKELEPNVVFRSASFVLLLCLPCCRGFARKASSLVGPHPHPKKSAWLSEAEIVLLRVAFVLRNCLELCRGWVGQNRKGKPVSHKVLLRCNEETIDYVSIQK